MAISAPQLFEWYARTVWKCQRHVVSGRLSARCRNCAISERAAPLTDGLCEACRNARESQPPQGDLEAAAAFDLEMQTAAATKMDRYHVLLLFSGGKDSTWLLWALRTRYPQLRVLAVLVDAGFLSMAALQNAASVASMLQVDLLISPISREESTAVFREAFLQARARGCYDTVDFADGEMSHNRGLKLARRLGIPLVLSGVSWAQVERIFGIRSVEVPGKTPRMLCPFWAWRLSELEILSDVTRAGLLNRKQSSPLVTNNQLVPLMGVVDILNLGYNSFEPEFCEMIREGRADVAFWEPVFTLLEYCAHTGWIVRQPVCEMLDRLGLSGAELGIHWA